MLHPPAISVPLEATRPVSPWSTASAPSIPSVHREVSAPPKFPHTRAQLNSIARQYRPSGDYDDDPDVDDSGLVTSALVTCVASLLDNEHEDELKILLKETFGPTIDDEEVGASHCIVYCLLSVLC